MYAHIPISRKTMIALYVISGLTVAGMFSLFLVLSHTLNNVINLLTKIEYLIRKESEYLKELEEIKRMIAKSADEEAQ